MSSGISPYFTPRVGVGLLFTFSAALLVACGGETGETTWADTSASSETAGTTGDAGTVSPTDAGSDGTTTAEASTTTDATAGTSTGETTGDTEETTGSLKPEDCVDLPIAGLELVSQQEHEYDSAPPVPLIRSSAPASLSGDQADDLLRILFDGALGVGVHQLDPDPNHAIPDYVKTYVPLSSAAAIYEEDLDGDAFSRTFVAAAGELEIVELLSTHQTAGIVRHVELREVVPNRDGQFEPLADGACYWIEEVEYDVRRPNGCTPYAAEACPADQFCMPTIAIGTDGECVTGGAKQEGEACTRVDSTHWDSDCELGLRCADFGDGDMCHRVCDVLSDAPGCPAGTHCGGGYNICMDEALLQQSGIDPAEVGEPCLDNPNALYCGGDGRPGNCYDDDGPGPLDSLCTPFYYAPSQCVAPQTGAYVAYKNGIDLSTLWCLTPP
ncbi:hypothetical protein [Nannocystis punicea]|uniref:Lipoprotein n=1 Tax=Nannocystis punicea TaxID=2995304 RepID=A0ABY7HBL2_9BACT|nr:hypothetical protein [Nannocystis poenicansa]WAS96497.1 hypothetical protein O0S08_10090 [Nannocystis poenicansa]